MERLNPLDAAFVDAEDQDRHLSMAIASIAVFEGPAPAYDEFCAAIEARAPLVPQYRRKLRTIPFHLGAPLWVDDPHFDLRFHIRETALPEPGDEAALARLTARVMANRLDRDHPLWEYWLVKGLRHDHWALISKVHHSMVDGISGTDLYYSVFDLSPDAVAPSAELPAPEPEPSTLSLLGLAARDAALLPLRDLRAGLAGLVHPAEVARRAAVTARGLGRFGTALLPARRSSLTGPIGQQRRYTWARVPLEDVKKVKQALGGTVNDVALAAVVSGYRTMLLERGEHPAAHMMPSLVPVSVRAPGDESIRDNRVSAMVANLPVDIEDPVERYAAVRRELSGLKRSGEAAAGETLVTLARYVPFPLAALTRFAFRLPQREIVTVTTNVPGPQVPIYAMGRRLVEMLPYVPIAYGLRTGVSIFSYCGALTFGITADYDTVPDADVLAHGIEAAVGELLKVDEPPGNIAPRRGKESP
jgi:WS/DGAT/MGAT family acyltransferase